MGIGANELGCFFDRSPERGDGNPGPPVMELFNGIAIGEHGDDLGNADTGVFNRKFTACPFRTFIKVFHTYEHTNKQTKKSQIL